MPNSSLKNREGLYIIVLLIMFTYSLEAESGFILLLKIWERMVLASFPGGAGESLGARLRWSHLVVCV